MAELVPWDSMDKVFFDHMSPDQGRASIDLRIVLDALLVKHIEGLYFPFFLALLQTFVWQEASFVKCEVEQKKKRSLLLAYA